MNIWRLKVRETQIQSCIRHKKFTIARRPRNPEVEKGDYLFLHLVVTDARSMSKPDVRIEVVSIFDYREYDFDG